MVAGGGVVNTLAFHEQLGAKDELIDGFRRFPTEVGHRDSFKSKLTGRLRCPDVLLVSMQLRLEISIHLSVLLAQAESDAVDRLDEMVGAAVLPGMGPAAPVPSIRERDSK
ncbi:hypothetical protein PF005_g13942 [Phytophthora fragariae]|uniref:Uncharacterized protein n=1 Tax=Phytophthora fragariae TaxID=53985 RepID=A0A6A3SHJ4_9STRA|nr:hypothetical protein PF003_g12447 [Phytophthora fragariae]KAE9117251.1 hypothetical protein PF007_g9356 [Phytophthora fragariae]KAE9204049.1 hypothetical protein PF005_g13942 [Phytophthora fragariae]KAE9303694.1 hypothetical protein PF001_g13435 [Phytophthora fragariae]